MLYQVKLQFGNNNENQTIKLFTTLLQPSSVSLGRLIKTRSRSAVLEVFRTSFSKEKTKILGNRQQPTNSASGRKLYKFQV
jgi:hypothetical protein